MKIIKNYFFLTVLFLVTISSSSQANIAKLENILSLRNEILNIDSATSYNKTLNKLDDTTVDLSDFLKKKLDSKNPLTGNDQAMVIQLIFSYHQAFLRADKNNLENQKRTLKSLKEIHQSIFNHTKLRRVLKSTFKTQLKKSAALDTHFDKLQAMTSRRFQRRNLQINNPYHFKGYAFSDGFTHFIDKAFHHISGAFGNLAGAIRWRKGRMYNRPDVTELVINNLKPLDIILERTPFALTDTFIPGNFGHAAIYMGTKQELIELGIWDSPFMKPYQNDIESGKTILEAIRPGTNLKTVAKFLKIDEMAVLRQENILDNKEMIKQIYEIGLNQIGKNYDFNFDVNSSDTIVCSELIYHAFGHIKWPTKYILGRHTISPDQLGELVFYKNNPVDFNIYYFAKSKKDLEFLPLKNLAKKLSFHQSETDESVFMKQKKVCRQVTKEVRHGRRSFKRAYKICTKKLKQLEYVPPTVYEL
tara:strand:- start:197807 stop:199228 length:1422 start_codon:yes stop_codon:yes gene_type:complete